MIRESNATNKRKVINDPVYGFITLQHDLIFDLIEHPWFQRLRRIKQLGLSHFVYPGALHTRFNHALGAVHLMGQAIEGLRIKGVKISEEEAEGLCAAILLHDVGHGPFSHALEHTIMQGIHHENVSLAIMNHLNEEFDGQLTLAISIFKGTYPRTFFHQLVSGQLDIDRLDYLTRDSFFTGVSEGIVSYDRILKMLDVVDDQLVVEEKGIHSIEKFILSRSIMYWQVYMHKTVLSAEFLITHLLRRARELVHQGIDVPTTPFLSWFMQNDVSDIDLSANPEVLNRFLVLDDNDVSVSTKMWSEHSDTVLSDLAKRLLDRKLNKVMLSVKPFSEEQIERLRNQTQAMIDPQTDLSYYFNTGIVSNDIYNPDKGAILVKRRDGSLTDFTELSAHMSQLLEGRKIQKHFIYVPKEAIK